MKPFKIVKVLSILLISLSIQANAQNEDYKKLFLERLKTSDIFDDANFADSALVVWPSPNLQHAMAYEKMAETLCSEHLSAGFLVVWVMNSVEYRRTKTMDLLFSHNCLDD